MCVRSWLFLSCIIFFVFCIITIHINFYILVSWREIFFPLCFSLTTRLFPYFFLLLLFYYYLFINSIHIHTQLYVFVHIFVCAENRIKDNVVIITNRLINILCIKSEIKHAHGIILVWSKLRLLLVLVVDVVASRPVVMIIISNIITVYYIFIWKIHHILYGRHRHTGNMCVYINHFLLLFHRENFLQNRNLIHSDAFVIHLFIYFSFILSICVGTCSSMASIYLFIYLYPVDENTFVFFYIMWDWRIFFGLDTNFLFIVPCLFPGNAFKLPVFFNYFSCCLLLSLLFTFHFPFQ